MNKILDIFAGKTFIRGKVEQLRSIAFEKPLQDKILVIDFFYLYEFEKSPFDHFAIFLANKLEKCSLSFYFKSLLQEELQKINNAIPLTKREHIDFSELDSELFQLQKRLETLNREEEIIFGDNVDFEYLTEYKSLLKDIRDTENSLISEIGKDRKKLEKKLEILKREKIFYEDSMKIEKKIPRIEKVVIDTSSLLKRVFYLQQKIEEIKNYVNQNQHIYFLEDSFEQKLSNFLASIGGKNIDLKKFKSGKNLGTRDIIKESFLIREEFGIDFNKIVLNDFSEVIDLENVLYSLRT